MSDKVWLPFSRTYSPLALRSATPIRSESGSVASTRSAPSREPSSMALAIVLRSSGLGDSTVGKLPSMTACSSTSETFVKPHLRSEPHAGAVQRRIGDLHVVELADAFGRERQRMHLI